jgi:preprotein translocase YajC subunit
MPQFLENILFDVFIIALFALGIYSFLVLPRQREFKRRQKVVHSLNVGMEVLTYGGIIGTVKRIDADSGVVYVEVSPGLELRFIAAAIMQEFDPKAYATAAKEHVK